MQCSFYQLAHVGSRLFYDAGMSMLQSCHCFKNGIGRLAPCWSLQGHSIRVAIAGVDAKHFYVDYADGHTMWIHTGPGCQSAVSFYTVSSQDT